MNLPIYLKKDKTYKRRNTRVKDFLWIEVPRLNIPWWPVCEMSNIDTKDRKMCPITPQLMKDEKGDFSTLIE